MATDEFKTGDRIMCQRSAGTFPMLRLGYDYEVLDVDDKGWVRIRDIEQHQDMPGFWNPTRFKLIEAANDNVAGGYNLADYVDINPPPGDLRGLKVILINAPPYAGKDTAGEAIVAAVAGAKVMKFAAALKRSVYVDFGLPYNLPLDLFDSVKDKPLPTFGGKSFRQRCIDKSELWMKTQCDDAVFGRLFRIEAARNRDQGMTTAVVTDSGFRQEALTLAEDVGPENMLLLQVHADKRGCTFAGDSRSYIDLPGVVRVRVDNDGDIADYRRLAVQVAREWLDSFDVVVDSAA